MTIDGVVLEDQQDLHLVFIGFEKTYDGVVKEILWKMFGLKMQV